MGVTAIRAAVAGVFAVATAAGAQTTNVRLAEMLGSWQGDDSVQFVELAITQDGSADVTGGTLTFTTGSQRQSLQLTRDVPNGSAGSAILFATDRATEVMGITPDFVLPSGYLPPLTGRICYQVTDASGTTDVVDCLAYGGFTGDNGSFGPAVRISPDDRALARVDTTGLNRSDWSGVLAPTPQNNAGTVVNLGTLCGDGNIDAGEVCDSANLDGQTCKSLGYSKGTLACSQCHFDVSGCVACGNGVINSGEQCDGNDFGNRTCTALGFTGGNLDCTTACKISTAECDPTYFVPGGGAAGPECLMEWKITNGSHRPGANGMAPVRQVCTDGDPACDADHVTGTCTFTVAVCFNVDDARFTKNGKACRHAPIARWSIVRATGTSAQGIVESASAAVAAMAPSMIDGDTITFAPPLEVEGGCAEAISAVVATGKTVVLKTRTVGSDGKPPDVDALKLVCIE